MNAISLPHKFGTPFAGFAAVLGGLLIGLLTPAGASAQLGYMTNRGTLWVSRCLGTPPAEVVIPASEYGMPVVNIGPYVFQSLAVVRSVRVPDTVTNVSYSAFENSGLTNLYLGSGVASFDLSSVASCHGLLSIEVSPGNTNFSSATGLLLDKAQAQLLKFPSGRAGAVGIPASVTTIGSGAFDFTNSLEIAIPAGVVSISAGAFTRCSALQGFVVDPANPVYGSLDGMLTDAARTRVLLFPLGRGGNYRIPDGVLHLGTGAFANNQRLTGIVLPSGLQSLGTNCFASCHQLRSAAITDPPAQFDPGAFRECWKLSAVTLPPTLTNVPANTFYRCGALTNFAWPRDLRSIDQQAFCGAGLRNLTCPDQLETIGTSAFEQCPLSTIAFGPGLRNIGSSAFAECTWLPQVTIPDWVTNVSGGAFWGCSALTNINLPLGLKSVEDSLFGNCSQLKNISLPAGITNVGGWAFSGCSNLVTINLPAGVVVVGDGAFYSCTNMLSVSLSPALQQLGRLAFSRCTRLRQIYLPAGVQNLATETFSGCIALETLILPAGMTNIDDYAFEACRSLGHLALPPGIKRVGTETFGYCTNLQTVTFPEALREVARFAFHQCSALKRVTLPAGLTELGDNAFGNCSQLAEVYFEGNAPTLTSGDPFPGLPAGALGFYLPQTTGWSSQLGSLPLMPWDPQVLTSSPQFGYQAGQFVVPVTGTSGRVIVLQASSDLENPAWVSLATNTLANGTLTFSDPAASAYPQRFYRLHWP